MDDVWMDGSKSIFCLMASQLFQHCLLIVSSFSTDLKYHIIHIPRPYKCLIVTKMALILYIYMLPVYKVILEEVNCCLDSKNYLLKRASEVM